jgi:hypothetical protein
MDKGGRFRAEGFGARLVVSKLNIEQGTRNSEFRVGLVLDDMRVVAGGVIISAHYS